MEGVGKKRRMNGKGGKEFGCKERPTEFVDRESTEQTLCLNNLSTL